MTTNDSSRQNHVTFSASCASTEAMVGDSVDTAAMGSTDAAAVGAATGDAEMEEEENWLFNEDLLCSVHGKKYVVSAEVKEDLDGFSEIKP